MPTVPTDKKPARYYDIEDAVARGWSIARMIRELHVDYYTIKKYFPNAGRPDLAGGQSLEVLNPEKHRAIGQMVAQGCSLNDIMVSLSVDHRTIKRAFPNAGWDKGGGGKAAEVKRGRKMIDGLELK